MTGYDDIKQACSMSLDAQRRQNFYTVCTFHNVLTYDCEVSTILDRTVSRNELHSLHALLRNQWRTEGGFGVFKPPPLRNSEDIGGVLDRMSKKSRRLDFLL